MDLVLHLFALGLNDVESFAKTVPDPRWAEQPAGIRNHLAWTLGHLCLGLDEGVTLLGRPAGCPPAWRKTMDYGTMPVADRAAYPAADELLGRFRERHAALAAAVREAPAEAMGAVNPHEALRPYFPTVGHEVAYYLSGHTDHHMGQLLAWRRAMGLSP